MLINATSVVLQSIHVGLSIERFSSLEMSDGLAAAMNNFPMEYILTKPSSNLMEFTVQSTAEINRPLNSLLNVECSAVTDQPLDLSQRSSSVSRKSLTPSSKPDAFPASTSRIGRHSGLPAVVIKPPSKLPAANRASCQQLPASQLGFYNTRENLSLYSRNSDDSMMAQLKQASPQDSLAVDREHVKINRNASLKATRNRPFKRVRPHNVGLESFIRQLVNARTSGKTVAEFLENFTDEMLPYRFTFYNSYGLKHRSLIFQKFGRNVRSPLDDSTIFSLVVFLLEEHPQSALLDEIKQKINVLNRRDLQAGFDLFTQKRRKDSSFGKTYFPISQRVASFLNLTS